MKKQINPTTKAHLIRGAFYLLLLVAVCAIPFTLAQRNTAAEKRLRTVQHSTGTLGVPRNPDFAPAGVIQQQLSSLHTRDAAMRASGAVEASGAEVASNIGAPLLPKGGCGTPGPWSTSTPGPPARYRAGGCTDGTYIYVYGGGNATANFRFNDLWRWNPATQTWTQLANMPTGKQNIQGAYWNGKIYVPGGYDASNTHITENAIYDIATNTWSIGAPLPAAQTGANVAFNNKIYNFGGNPGPQSTVRIYDIATNTWSNGAAMPVAITYGRAVASTLGTPYAYYAGGITTVTVNTLYRYDFAANTWATMAPLQTARTSEELMTSPLGTELYAVMGGDATFFTGVPLPVSVEIYSIGGNSWTYGNPVVTKAAAPSGGLAGAKAMVQGGVDNTTYYDTVQVSVVPCGTPTPTATASPTPTTTGTPSCTPAWQNEPAMANARRNPATVAVGSDLYAITGFNAAPDYTAVNERFNGSSWATMAPIPVPHAQSRGTAVGTNIYVPGGFNSISFGGPLDTMQIYNTTTNTWSAGMTLPAARSGVATATFNGLVYVIGGYNPVGTGHNEVYIYNPGTNSYTTGASMPAGQGNVAGVLFNGEIYVVGGGTAPGAQYAYNPATNAWRTIAALPTTGGTCQSDNGFVLDNELWIVGCLGLPINQQVWIYNPGTNSWRAGLTYNVDHQGPGAALFNSRGFVVGGGAAGGGSTAVESIGPCPGGSPTPTATASPSCTPGPIILQGSIDDTEPFHNSVNGAASSCAVSPPCPGELVGEFHYDTYQLNNPSNNPVCITVTLSDPTCIYSETYLGSFDPNNACTNYLADSNLGASYQVTVPGNATIVVVVEEFTEMAGCPSYTVTIDGLGSCASPTPTPASPTPTATFTPTPTATATFTPTATATATATPTATVEPRSTPTPRPRPTPAPRP